MYGVKSQSDEKSKEKKNKLYSEKLDHNTENP
jgi:hypothetical protein